MATMRRTAALILLIAAASAPAQAEDPHLGLTEYELSCMPCHGVDGRGDGPRARTLKIAPADLTKIAKSNKGQFPTRRLAEIIDGRAIVAEHGQRDMPIWGDRYRIRVEAKEADATIERRAQAQIAALVRYLRSIQENSRSGVRLDQRYRSTDVTRPIRQESSLRP